MVVVVILISLFFFVSVEAIGYLLKKSRREVAGPVPVQPFSEIHLPRGLFVDDRHGWARLTESGELRLGADEFLSQAIGAIDAVEMPAPGAHVAKGQPLASLRCGQRSIDVKSPVSGTVVSVNHSLEEAPAEMARDPYGAGWLAAVWPVEHVEALKGLKVGERAVAWLDGEVQRFVEFLARQTTPDMVGATLPDGARPVVGSAGTLEDRGWDAFIEEFVD